MKPACNSIVRFRSISVTDVDALYSGAFGVAEVSRHLQWATHANSGETRVLIDEMVGLHQAGKKFFWVTLCAHDGRIVGLSSIRPDGDTAWIGFLVVSGEQRKGFGFAMVAAMEEAVLDCFPSVSASVEPENRASIGLLRRSGWLEWANPDVLPLLAFQKRKANGSQPIRSIRSEP